MKAAQHWNPPNKFWPLNYSKSLQYHMRGRTLIMDVAGRAIRFLEVAWNRRLYK